MRVLLQHTFETVKENFRTCSDVVKNYLLFQYIAPITNMTKKN